MNVLGISGSPRQGSTTDQLVKEVLQAVDVSTEFVSLAELSIKPCTACLGCVEDNTCVLSDDMAELREKIVAADAYVIGAANYFGALNALAHCFMERWYQFRHREGAGVAGKLGIAVGVGGGDPEAPAQDVRRFFEYNRIDCIDAVTALGPACCFTCGFGEACRVGAIHMFFGEGTKITPEIVPQLDKQPEARARATQAGRRLTQRLQQLAAGT
jgi:multimeric flavodoxin WrbA